MVERFIPAVMNYPPGAGAVGPTVVAGSVVFVSRGGALVGRAVLAGGLVGCLVGSAAAMGVVTTPAKPAAPSSIAKRRSIRTLDDRWVGIAFGVTLVLPSLKPGWSRLFAPCAPP